MRSSVLDRKREVREEKTNHSYTIPKSPSKAAHAQVHKPALVLQRLFIAPDEGWLPMLLLFIALYCVASSIIAADWVSHSLLLLISPIAGLVIGLVIARIKKVPQPVLHIGACLLGYWLAIWLTSAVAFHVHWVLLLSGIRQALTGTMAFGSAASTEMLFFFYLTFLVYFLGYFGSWLVYRARLPWLVAMVYSAILLVNLYYVKRDLSYLVLIQAGAILLLVARVHITNQVQRWMREGLHPNTRWLHALTGRCIQVASILTLLALVVSWLLPIQGQPSAGKSFWDQVNNAVVNITNGRASLQDPQTMLQPYQPSANYFGDQLMVTGSVHLPVGEVLHYSSVTGPHYLESFTYNLFDGHTWTSSLASNTPRNFDANTVQPLDTASTANAQRIATSITIVRPPQGSKNYIFAPAQPVSFDVPTAVYSDGTAATWTQQGPLKVQETYHVVSFLPPSDPAVLSGIPLPSTNPGVWRNDENYSQLALYYIQVPRDLSPAVMNTTRSWTNGATDTYMALKMLERHLSDQKKFTYSVDNPTIPANIDVVDWLLQKHNGYCTYYASAMAVMGRLLGVPTRIVSGFSNGHYAMSGKLWLVDGSDAHSWVQAYFPRYGWINFEPTPGYSLDSTPPPSPMPTPSPTVKHKRQNAVPVMTPTPQPLKNSMQPRPTPTPVVHTSARSPIHNATTPANNQALLLWLAGAMLLLSIVVLLFAAVRYWWRSLYADCTFIAGVYWRICWLASRVGLAPKKSQTPYEYSRMLSQYLPQGVAPLRRLTELFVLDRWAKSYGAAPLYRQEDVEQHWHTLRNMLLHLFFKRKK